MKNVLLATAAFVATAGVAAADLSLSGGARFGIVHDDSRANNETRVHNRFTLNMDATAETESGAEYFARVRVRGGNTGDTGLSASGVSAPRVGVRFNGLTVAVGNITGALESAPGLYDGNVGLTGLGWNSLTVNNSAAGAFAWDSFSSAGAGSNGVEVIYSSGGLGFHISHSSSAAGGTADRTAAHISYKFGNWTAALAHQESDVVGEDMTVVNIKGSLGAADVGLSFADNEGDRDAVRINGAFEVASGTKVIGFATFADGANRDDAFGLGVTHSLGGATFKAGVSKTFTGSTVADMGVSFGF